MWRSCGEASRRQTRATGSPSLERSRRTTSLIGRGRAAQAIHAVYPTRRFEPLAFYEAQDRVAVRVRVVARGVGSSVEVDAERGYVLDVRDGKIVRFAWFNEPFEALKAVGLDE